MWTKICSNCMLNKLMAEFHKRGNGKLQSYCKLCYKIVAKKYRTNNKDSISEYNKQYIANDENKKSKYAYNRQYHQSNKKDISEKKKQYYIENRDDILAAKKQNKEIVNKREKQRKITDPSYKLRRSISSQISNALKRMGSSKNGISCLKCLYPISELRQHLENQFEPWMNWNNWSKYDPRKWDDNDPSTWTWQIDHIIPQSKLPYSSMEEQAFRECWALSNLRPYSAKQNIIDGASRNL